MILCYGFITLFDSSFDVGESHIGVRESLPKVQLAKSIKTALPISTSEFQRSTIDEIPIVKRFFNKILNKEYLTLRSYS